MNDDFNFAEAIGVLFELAKFININGYGTESLISLGNIIGLFNDVPDTNSDPLTDEIESLIQARVDARKNKDFQKADEIRDQLLNEYQIIIEDTPEGIRWKKKS